MRLLAGCATYVLYVIVRVGVVIVSSVTLTVLTFVFYRFVRWLYR